MVVVVVAGEIRMFGAEDFVGVTGAGGVDLEVYWGFKGRQMKQLVGRLVRIKFYLKDANLYSFRIQ